MTNWATGRTAVFDMSPLLSYFDGTLMEVGIPAGSAAWG